MEIVRAILVNLAVPLAGFLVFIFLRNKMLGNQIEHPPVVPPFIVFATYGDGEWDKVSPLLGPLSIK